MCSSGSCDRAMELIRQVSPKLGRKSLLCARTPAYVSVGMASERGTWMEVSCEGSEAKGMASMKRCVLSGYLRVPCGDQ